MLINAQETIARLNSPSNLMNRLAGFKSRSANSSNDSMKLFGLDRSAIEASVIGMERATLGNQFESEPSSADFIDKQINPAEKDNVTEVLDSLEEKTKKDLIKNTAQTVLGDSIELLRRRLPEIDKARDLAHIAGEMQKVLASMEPKNKDEDKQPSQVIIYRPIVHQESHFKSVHVVE